MPAAKGKTPVEAMCDHESHGVRCGEAVEGTGEHDRSKIVPCGYQMHKGCNYPGTEGLRPLQCATCGSGTQQNLLARAQAERQEDPQGKQMNRRQKTGDQQHEQSKPRGVQRL